MNNYTFTFTAHTTDGTIVYAIKAKDKKTAIDKAFAKLRKNGFSSTNWDCKLNPTF